MTIDRLLTGRGNSASTITIRRPTTGNQLPHAKRRRPSRVGVFITQRPKRKKGRHLARGAAQGRDGESATRRFRSGGARAGWLPRAGVSGESHSTPTAGGSARDARSASTRPAETTSSTRKRTAPDFANGRPIAQSFGEAPLSSRTLVYEDSAGNCRAIVDADDMTWLQSRL